MHIEISEFLRCPEPHPPTHCVVVPHQMVDRRVIEGVVGCPACQREYPIAGGTVRFGSPPAISPKDVPNPGDVIALLGITSPGGCVVFVGSAAQAANAFQETVEGVHCIIINEGAPGCSVLESATTIPLRDSMARGVVLGEEYERWATEAVRVLLPGLRLVSLAGAAAIPGLGEIVTGNGVMVGRKTT